MSERDPRVDPKPRDLLRSGACRFRVMVVGSGIVEYQMPPLRANYSTTLADWRKRMAGAEVIERGNE